MTAFSTVVAMGAVALLFSGAAAAASAKASDAELLYQKQRAACLSGESPQDRTTCLREVGAALQEARRGGLTSADERVLERNRLMRCNALPEPDREDCARRMSAEGTVSGSVDQGGILRELTRTLPASAK